jgi:hypothetical protein
VAAASASQATYIFWEANQRLLPLKEIEFLVKGFFLNIEALPTVPLFFAAMRVSRAQCARVPCGQSGAKGARLTEPQRTMLLILTASPMTVQLEVPSDVSPRGELTQTFPQVLAGVEGSGHRFTLCGKQ